MRLVSCSVSVTLYHIVTVNANANNGARSAKIGTTGPLKMQLQTAKSHASHIMLEDMPIPITIDHREREGNTNSHAHDGVHDDYNFDDHYTNYQYRHASPLSKLRRMLFHHHNSKMNSSYSEGRSRRHQMGSKPSSGFGFGHKSMLSPASTRTRFMLRLPSPEELFEVMFAGADDSRRGRGTTGMLAGAPLQLQLHFNHEHVGMTKPPQRTTRKGKEKGFLPSSASSSATKTTCTKNSYTMDIYDDHLDLDDGTGTGMQMRNNDIYQIENASTCTKKQQVSLKDCTQLKKTTDELWWPSTSTKLLNNFQPDQWRVKRYTKRVGRGRECYDRARDAALDWEFRSESKSSLTGIIRAREGGIDSDLGSRSRSRSRSRSPIVENTNPDILQIWDTDTNVGDGTGSGSSTHTRTSTHSNLIMNNAQKKLATFTQFQLPSLGLGLGRRFPGRLPSLYAVNPVAVVYDVVDENELNGDLFSSTAYATLQGHLLSGEERVSVILRGDVGVGIGSGSGVNTDEDANAVDIEIVSFSKPAPSLLGKLVWPFVTKKQDDFFKSELDALETKTADK